MYHIKSIISHTVPYRMEPYRMVPYRMVPYGTVWYKWFKLFALYKLENDSLSYRWISIGPIFELKVLNSIRICIYSLSFFSIIIRSEGTSEESMDSYWLNSLFPGAKHQHVYLRLTNR